MNPAIRLGLRYGVLRMRVHHVDAFRDRGDVSMLIHAVSAERFRVRLAAVDALGRLSGDEAIRTLKTAMRDSVKEVALKAIEIVRRIDAESATDIAEAEAYWEARSQRKHREPLPVDGKLIDGDKLERYQQFKQKVLAQAGKGQFYG
ncbi:MAG: HEAT repeat domain-containing protein [Rhodothermales bacterium]